MSLSANNSHIIEHHNFERDLHIQKIITNKQHNTQIEKEIVDVCEEKKPTEATEEGTRIITLKNKNVPAGVHLAIAVDKSKFFSKNALKKIARNLAKEM